MLYLWHEREFPTDQGANRMSDNGINIGAMMEEGERIFDSAVNFIKRFVQFAHEDHARVLAAWCFHTHAMEVAHSTPYIYITSAKMRSGKSTLLEVVETLAHNAERTVSITPAAMLYLMNEGNTTLMIDEIDTIYSGGKGNEAMRGALNGGYRRGATFMSMDRDGVKRIKTFGPKMFAGIDTGIPATVKDRSITIMLDRRKDGQSVEPFRPVRNASEGHIVRAEIHDWCLKYVPHLRDAVPASVFGLDDRAQEIAEPLVAIMEACGERVGVEGRGAIATVLADRNSEDEQVTLLTTILNAFDGEEKITTADLLDIVRVDRPGMTSRELAKNCSGWFNASPTTLNMGGDDRAKGYRLMDFANARKKFLD